MKCFLLISKYQTAWYPGNVYRPKLVTPTNVQKTYVTFSKVLKTFCNLVLWCMANIWNLALYCEKRAPLQWAAITVLSDINSLVYLPMHYSRWWSSVGWLFWKHECSTPGCMFQRQNRSTEGCSRLERSVDMTSSGNSLHIKKEYEKAGRSVCNCRHTDKWYGTIEAVESTHHTRQTWWIHMDTPLCPLDGCNSVGEGTSP